MKSAVGKITYTKQGDYLLPDLDPPKEKDIAIGRYGRLRKAYLKITGVSFIQTF